ncbi:MAG: hypothetical protein KME31_03400 [Tolypothrix carrinoi HA7290-LM1]|nr:hypothetical protein [Tolypothrix carrinoi HA7290-LM1]
MPYDGRCSTQVIPKTALPMADTLLKSGNPSCAGVLPNAQCPRSQLPIPHSP